MQLNKEFVPESDLVRSFMPSIKLTVADLIVPDEKFVVYMLIRYEFTSIGMSLRVTRKENGYYEVKGSHENKATNILKLLDQVLGIDEEHAAEFLGDLVDELFVILNPYGPYDVSKVMQSILPWAEKRSMDLEDSTDKRTATA